MVHFSAVEINYDLHTIGTLYNINKYYGSIENKIVNFTFIILFCCAKIHPQISYRIQNIKCYSYITRFCSEIAFIGEVVRYI